MLIGGYPRGRGLSPGRPPTATRRCRDRRAEGPSWSCSTSGSRAARSTASRSWSELQARPSRSAGDHVQRPRHDRDRGRRDQEGRLRLHREAVQVRPAAAADRARASRPRGCGARTRSCRLRAGDETELIGTSPAINQRAPADRARGADRQPRV